MLDAKFFGRESYLLNLHKRVSDLKNGYRHNMAIIGDELLGKTSLICRLLSSYYDNNIIPVYMQVRPESFSVFARRFIGALLYNFLSCGNLNLKEDLDFLINKSSGYAPATTVKIRELLLSIQKRKKINLFGELIALCEHLHKETGKYCLVIFDEFHNLESLGVNKIYPQWSKALMSQKSTMFIITSSFKFRAKQILAKDLSLLFGNFEVLEIEPFDTRLSAFYLKKYLPQASSGALSFLVHFTGGYPFYLDVISEALNARADLNVVDALEELLFESSGMLNQRFSNYLKRFTDSSASQDFVTIMYHICNGHNRVKDIAHLMHKPANVINARVNTLMEMDAVSKNGDFVRINDRVFGFWLKFVYQEKLNSFTFDARNQKNLFRAYVEGMLDEFTLINNRPLSERMQEILKLFGDDIIQVSSKRLRLAAFREIKPLEFNNRNLKHGLLGRSSDALWIMALKQDQVSEEFVAEFAKECRRYHHKAQKKVIVSLNEVDTNARLRAMEEKIITWDLNSLNQIFDLFYKPRIVPLYSEKI
ncbi:MAG: hypothetical protein MUF05_02095 [Candidatus Omnitrophica bacterium]|jgi:hypothetical protein|nr:hypothetical protein [Candidatus Omnitrophota bacterium]